MSEEMILDLISSNLIYLLLAILVVVVIFKAVKIVPQSEQHVVERFGKLRKVMGPGIKTARDDDEVGAALAEIRAIE